MNIAQIEENIKQLVEDLSSGVIKESAFIYELLLAYGHRKQSVTRLRSGERNLSKDANEVIWKRHLYFRAIDNDELLINIDQIRKDKQIERHKIRFIIVTNSNQLLAVDTKTTDTLDIELSELPKHFDFFLPWAGMEKAVYQGENPADVKAAEKMAKLFDLIKADNFDDSNRDDKEALHNLNVFLTRLLFCFFAEDTEIFSENQFSMAIKSHTSEDGIDVSEYLNRLFEVLNTAEENRTGLPEYLATFPYVNGGLFTDHIKSPKFSAKSRRMLIECGNDLDWSDINPDIFGSMIQAVVHPDQRGGMGMHYTSVTNIMKVIEPLFLNDLYEEFEKNEDKPKKLQELLQRIGLIKIFDPACGSGNFLIIAYKELRNLEIEILKRMQEVASAGMLIKPKTEIKLTQFYGIELDDFAHEVAILSLWLAEHQMNVDFKIEFGDCSASLPLKRSGNIVCDNATRIKWHKICPNDGEVYILGNPPYLGSSLQSKDNKEDMSIVFDEIKGYKNLDYIACWFLKGCMFISNEMQQLAFVSTNSICQGEQVSILWPIIFKMNKEIGFSYDSFKWANNAKNNAGVICTIINLREPSLKNKSIYGGSHVKKAKHISPYLVEGSNTIVSKRSLPFSNLPAMTYGNKAVDNGYLILSDEEKNELIEECPLASAYIKKLVGSVEFIRGKSRWCLWIDDTSVKKAMTIPSIKSRVGNVKKFRLQSKKKATQHDAEFPYKFGEVRYNGSHSIIIPRVSSDRREYIPIGFLGKGTIILDSAQAIYDADPYIFGIISSRMHLLWVKATAGKLKNDYRYSSALCYNTFPLPELSDQDKNTLNQYSLSILEEREKYPAKTISELYDPDKMPGKLKKCHQDLDVAFEAIITKLEFKDDDDRLSFLFKMYDKISGKE